MKGIAARLSFKRTKAGAGRIVCGQSQSRQVRLQAGPGGNQDMKGHLRPRFNGQRNSLLA